MTNIGGGISFVVAGFTRYCVIRHCSIELVLKEGGRKDIISHEDRDISWLPKYRSFL